MLHFLYILDLYYGRTGFKSLASQLRRGEIEAEDVLAVLRNDPLAPLDLREKSLKMAGILLEMAGETRNGYKLAQDVLDSGDALIKMREIIKAQGKVKKPSLGKFRYQVRSGKIGKIRSIDSDSIAKIARIAGAPVDKGAGLYLHQKSGKIVRKGELLFTIYLTCSDWSRVPCDFPKCPELINNDHLPFLRLVGVTS